MEDEAVMRLRDRITVYTSGDSLDSAEMSRWYKRERAEALADLDSIEAALAKSEHIVEELVKLATRVWAEQQVERGSDGC